MATGECNCGAVQFEIDADLQGVYVCHCSICRRSTGSNGIAVVVVPNDRFRWVGGEEHIATWKKPHTNWQTWFCRVCGSSVPVLEDGGSHVVVPAGALDDDPQVRPIVHIHTASKAPWFEIADALPRFAEFPPEEFWSEWE